MQHPCDAVALVPPTDARRGATARWAAVSALRAATVTIVDAFGARIASIALPEAFPSQWGSLSAAHALALVRRKNPAVVTRGAVAAGGSATHHSDAAGAHPLLLVATIAGGIRGTNGSSTGSSWQWGTAVAAPPPENVTGPLALGVAPTLVLESPIRPSRAIGLSLTAMGQVIVSEYV
jgi:hypothetical protein